jgi:hypothetical protein
MEDRSPGRGADAPEDGSCSATPRRGVKNAPATQQAPRPHAPLVTAPTDTAPARDQLVALTTQGAYVLLLDHATGAPICEPTRDPAAITRAWDANRRYRPRPAIAATKRGAAVQPPTGWEVWWPPTGWQPGVPVVELAPTAPTPGTGPAPPAAAPGRPVAPPGPATAAVVPPPAAPRRRRRRGASGPPAVRPHRRSG